MAKMNKNQIQFGSLYNTEKYYNVLEADGSKSKMTRYFFTGDTITGAFHMLEAGFRRPEHKHPHEQCLLGPVGDGELHVDGKIYSAEPGFFAIIPPHVPHTYSCENATSTCWNLDFFEPIRLEYQKDNYFELLAKGENPATTMITE